MSDFNKDIIKIYFTSHIATGLPLYLEKHEKPGIWQFRQKKIWKNLEFEKIWKKPEKPGIRKKKK